MPVTKFRDGQGPAAFSGPSLFLPVSDGPAARNVAGVPISFSFDIQKPFFLACGWQIAAGGFKNGLLCEQTMLSGAASC